MLELRVGSPNGGIRVQGLGFYGFRVQGFRLQGLGIWGFRGLGFRGSGFKVPCSVSSQRQLPETAASVPGLTEKPRRQKARGRFL